MNDECYSTMRFAREDRVLTVFLGAPAASGTPDGALHEELGQLFRDLRDERDVRAAVLTGAGRDFFTGLGDPVGSLLWQREAGLDVIESGHRVARDLIWDLLDVEIPVVAALNGDAATLGATIALSCDAVFMAENACLRDPHVQIGVVAGDGAAALWPLMMGPALAKRHLLTGDPIAACDAERLGLVTHVCERATVLAEAQAFTARLAANAPLAVRYTKKAVNKVLKDAIAGAFEQGLAHEMLTFMSDDMVEALTALRDGRTPTFHGR